MAQRISTARLIDLAYIAKLLGCNGAALAAAYGHFGLVLPAAAVFFTGFVWSWIYIRCPQCGARTSIDHRTSRRSKGVDAAETECVDCGYQLNRRWGQKGEPTSNSEGIWSRLKFGLWLVTTLWVALAIVPFVVQDKCLDSGGRIDSRGRCEH